MRNELQNDLLALIDDQLIVDKLLSIYDKCVKLSNKNDLNLDLYPCANVDFESMLQIMWMNKIDRKILSIRINNTYDIEVYLCDNMYSSNNKNPDDDLLLNIITEYTSDATVVKQIEEKKLKKQKHDREERERNREQKLNEFKAKMKHKSIHNHDDNIVDIFYLSLIHI